MKLNSTIRTLFSLLFAVLLFVACFQLAKMIAGGKEKPAQVYNKVAQTVYVDTVKNGDITIKIDATGNLQAKDKIELFAEVQGVFKGGSQSFKAGQKFSAGSTIISIDNAEYKASLIAARSSLYNQITALMPDLQLDYPSIASKWNDYLLNFDINKSVPQLPQFSTDQEKFLVNSKGIVNAYYNIKNKEERLTKYNITAPYNGILTEALVQEGALIRAGQKLGTFINPNVYELELAINESYKDLLKIGNKVQLKNLKGTKFYKGKVKRLNEVVDPSTQSVTAYIEVSGNDLNEGTYLEAVLDGKVEQNVIEISRKLLLDNNQVYAVKDSTLYLQKVNPIYFSQDKAVVKGIPDNTLILSKSSPNLYSGMLVKISSEK